MKNVRIILRYGRGVAQNCFEIGPITITHCFVVISEFVRFIIIHVGASVIY